MSAEPSITDVLEVLIDFKDAVALRFDGLEKRFDDLEKRFDDLEKRFDDLHNEFGFLRVDFRSVDRRLAALEIKVLG
ncbi:MAG: hypothetical protein JOZ38_01300 [Candidatus Eremiobacteraeota bacterium]|nr:hypothetical protein [Candidatus Eremiobacteraeota bacterium]